MSLIDREVMLPFENAVPCVVMSEILVERARRRASIDCISLNGIGESTASESVRDMIDERAREAEHRREMYIIAGHIDSSVDVCSTRRYQLFACNYPRGDWIVRLVHYRYAVIWVPRPQRYLVPEQDSRPAEKP